MGDEPPDETIAEWAETNKLERVIIVFENK